MPDFEDQIQLTDELVAEILQDEEGLPTGRRQRMVLAAVRIAQSGEDRCILNDFANSDMEYGDVNLGGLGMKASRAALIIHSGEKPEGGYAMHLETCPKNCCNPNHLHWGTNAENLASAAEAGKFKHGEDHWCNKIAEADIPKILMSPKTCKQEADERGVSPCIIEKIRKRIRWAHVPDPRESLPKVTLQLTGAADEIIKILEGFGKDTQHTTAIPTLFTSGE